MKSSHKISSQHSSTFLASYEGKDKEFSVNQRGATAKQETPIPFDIAYMISEPTEKGLKQTLVSIMREKLLNDLVAANALLGSYYSNSNMTLNEIVAGIVCPSTPSIKINASKEEREKELSKTKEEREQSRIKVLKAIEDATS